MTKRKLTLLLSILILTILTASLLAGCNLKAEDCYVFDNTEFESLWQEDNSKLDDSAIRIMSANVLVHIKSWGGEPVKPRAHRFAEAVKHYQPDVIAMQEMCSEWYKYLMPQLSNYKLIESKNSLFMENRSPIIYNTDKLELLESCLQKYSRGDNNGCRVVTRGVFKNKADGKKFIVTSTHLNLIRMTDYEKEKSIMLSQVDEFFNLIDKLSEKYPDAPIFMAGDYNSMEHENSRYNGNEYTSENDLTYYKCYGKPCGSFAYEKITQKYIDTKFITGIERRFANSHEYNYDDPTWDHIFMTNENNAKVLTFNVLASDYFHNNTDRTSRISDHLPIYVDVKI